jgi:hypothetical protein
MVCQATMGIQEDSNNEGITKGFDIENITATVGCVNGTEMVATQ